MATSFQFGLVVRGQAEAGEDITKRFDETIELVRLADHLVMSAEWAGMPHSLATETIEIIASELIIRVRQGL